MITGGILSKCLSFERSANFLEDPKDRVRALQKEFRSQLGKKGGGGEKRLQLFKGEAKKNRHWKLYLIIGERRGKKRRVAGRPGMQK